MKEGYIIRNQERIHFITATVVDWIDVFTRNSYRNVVIESLAFCIEKKIQTEPESRREWMLERFKKATETHSRNKNYQFWQYGNHAEEVYSHKFMWSKLDYIHLNPVRAGIVEKASHYRYSSASNYVNNQGLVTIEIVDHPVIDVLKKASITKYNQY